jgi:hypothetical protein
MTWVQIQHAEQGTLADHDKVARLIGNDQPEGLILRATGEVDGRWKAVSVWDSREAFERFARERLRPAVLQALGDDAAAAGPPRTEWFEAKHLISR